MAVAPWAAGPSAGRERSARARRLPGATEADRTSSEAKRTAARRRESGRTTPSPTSARSHQRCRRIIRLHEPRGGLGRSGGPRAHGERRHPCSGRAHAQPHSGCGVDRRHHALTGDDRGAAAHEAGHADAVEPARTRRHPEPVRARAQLPKLHERRQPAAARAGRQRDHDLRLDVPGVHARQRRAACTRAGRKCRRPAVPRNGEARTADLPRASGDRPAPAIVERAGERARGQHRCGAAGGGGREHGNDEHRDEREHGDARPDAAGPASHAEPGVRAGTRARYG